VVAEVVPLVVILLLQ
jgi:hypothetical protein